MIRYIITRAIAAILILVAICVIANAQVYAAESVHFGDTGQAVIEIQQDLASFGYVLAIDGQFGLKTWRAVTHFQRSSGLTVDGYVGPITRAAMDRAVNRLALSTEISASSEPPFASPAKTDADPYTGLSGCALMKAHRQAVGLPAWFDDIVWRESRCRAEPSVRTWCCVGPLQLYVSLHLRDSRIASRYHACGVRSEADVDGPNDIARHYCAARALYDVQGASAWSL